MVLSLIARRMALGAMVSAAARIAHPAVLSVATRRTLFATPQCNFPPAKASQKAAKKPAKEKQPKQEKPRARIPKSLQPPKRAPGPFSIFFASFVKSQPRASSLRDCQEFSKRAGEIWRGFSTAEKQPFYDESEAKHALAKQEREEFFRNTSQSDLKQLNAIRKSQGKPKLREARKPSVPASPFIFFSNEFRKSPDGQALIDGSSPGREFLIRTVVAAADRWKSMSPEEKAPYFERYKKEREELKSEHAD